MNKLLCLFAGISFFRFTVFSASLALAVPSGAPFRTVKGRLKPTPAPTATPTPAPCITIISPANGAVVSGGVAITTNDTCSGVSFESLYVDGQFQANFSAGQVAFNSIVFANGNHLIEVSSQSANPGSVMLGNASITLSVQNQTSTKTPTSTATPTPGPSASASPTPIQPTPAATPTASCIGISAPSPSSTVSGANLSITTNDTCSGAWFESLYVDNIHVSDFSIGSVVFNSTSVGNGLHSIEVTSQSQNPGTVQLGSTVESLNVQNTPTPSPTATPSATPTPNLSSYFAAQPGGTSLPADGACNAAIATTPETIINMPVSGQSFHSSNTAFNAQVPTQAELSSFAANGYTFSPVPDYSQFQRITGAYPSVHGGTPSTDMILRFAACKYGIDEDVVRAQAWQEGWWRQASAGDIRTGSGYCIQGSFSALYNTAISLVDGNTIPAVPGGCYQSWSTNQTKVFYEWMTWPEIKDSTTFAAEYRDATQRTCMNGGYRQYMPSSYMTDVNNYLANPNGTDPNASDWDAYPALSSEPAFAPTYANRVMWGCIGTHYAGFDWLDSNSLPYILDVQGNEACKRWRTPSTTVTGACSSPINKPGF
jgi:hypothetical protein